MLRCAWELFEISPKTSSPTPRIPINVKIFFTLCFYLGKFFSLPHVYEAVNNRNEGSNPNRERETDEICQTNTVREGTVELFNFRGRKIERLSDSRLALVA